MPSSGSGTGHPVGGGTPGALYSISGGGCPAVSLARYFHIIDVTECAGFGVSNPDDPLPGCNRIWTLSQREMVEHALLEAQEEIEAVTAYPLAPCWYPDEPHPYAYPVFAKWGRIIAAGVRATSNIGLGASVSYATDPSIVGPLPTTVTDPNEIAVYLPGTDIAVLPSAITIAAGVVTIQIPRCRLVQEVDWPNPEEGWPYADVPPSATSPFTPTVDVKRVYNDPSTNATLVWPHSCNGSCSSSGCTSYTRTACMRIRQAETSSIETWPATYANGVWTGTTTNCCYGTPQRVHLNYMAGMYPLSRQAEDAVIRLAHSKMPQEVCACETWSRLWKRDQFVPAVLTAEWLNCPFGFSAGSLNAWRFANSMRLVRGSVL